MADLCGCKATRFCALCKESERVKRLKIAPENTNDKFSSYKCYVFENGKAFSCPELNYKSTIEDIQKCLANKQTDDCFELQGIYTINSFLNEKEEEELVQRIDSAEWLLSQSGRRKQDYGPKVKFNERKVKCERFIGIPDYADLILQRLESFDVEKFGNYQPFELCNLEYCAERQAAIDMHQDDNWIWGERLISLNLIEDSIMTFENEEKKALVFVYLAQRSILCFCNEARFKWNHGIFSWHIQNRRYTI